MSSAQIIVHQRENNTEYKLISENIADRCKGLLQVLETKLVTNAVNQIIQDLDNLGNSFDNSTKYDDQQKEFIKQQIFDIAK